MPPISPRTVLTSSRSHRPGRRTVRRTVRRVAAGLWAATWAAACLAPAGFAQGEVAQEGILQSEVADGYAPAPLGAGAFNSPRDTPLPAPAGDAQVPGFAEPPEFGQARLPGPPRPSVDSLPGTPFFADTEFGAQPTPGEPGAPGFGLPHRSEQSARYGIWYRPKSLHAPNRAVYRPSPWRPRGFGNLFDRPCVTDRMDYSPYAVEDLPSRYGPTYFPHYRENTECLIRPTRHYDKGPSAEANTGGCRLGGDCLGAVGHADCPGCRPPGFLQADRTAARSPAAPRACGCERCRANR